MSSAKEKVAFYKRDAYDKLGSSSDTIPAISHKEEIPKARTQKPWLVKKPEILKGLLPDFSLNCRRLTPAPGYIEALTKDHVDCIRTPITRFTETGISRWLMACTGRSPPSSVPRGPIQTSCLPSPSESMARRSEACGIRRASMASRIRTSGWPRWLPEPTLRPRPAWNQPLGNGAALHGKSADFAKGLRKAAREGRVDDLLEYVNAFFAATVLADGCNSWYNGGRPGASIHGIWPGSAAHVTSRDMVGCPGLFLSRAPV
ncbi:hypothetical protein OIDMADRAFT_61290 [Oidiodendron maius Zn]|uniref:Uncharacterized protein n=1 Tax=Oidiodendron maius (strain Zn) TaxID=913774 RepID=A0A0C3GTE6_OIDMZ|nr:hypothetical protein OIDMADRAFT_61290 [Oidiodendron maius Zn]